MPLPWCSGSTAGMEISPILHSGSLDLDRHEADGGTIHLGDPHPRLIRGADVFYRPPLISGNHLKSKFVERAY
jgi:hypothetical protein